MQSHFLVFQWYQEDCDENMVSLPRTMKAGPPPKVQFAESELQDSSVCCRIHKKWLLARWLPGCPMAKNESEPRKQSPPTYSNHQTKKWFNCSDATNPKTLVSLAHIKPVRLRRVYWYISPNRAMFGGWKMFDSVATILNKPDYHLQFFFPKLILNCYLPLGKKSLSLMPFIR